MFSKQANAVISAILVAGLYAGGSIPAQAENCWHDSAGKQHCTGTFFQSRTGKIVKDGLLGAGIGAGAGLLLGRPVGRTALVGARVGAGAEAIHTSNTLNRHPIVKTGLYGAVAGAGASSLFRNGSLGKGALIGGAVGTGVGVVKDKHLINKL